MIVKHYKSIEKMSIKNRKALSGLMECCSFMSNKDIKNYIDVEQKVSVFCAFDDHQNMFAFACVKEGFEKYYLDYLFVDEAFRGYGYGEKLLRCVCDYANKIGKSSVMLLVSKANARAISLYSKNKFIKTRLSESKKCFYMKKYTSNEVYYAGQILYYLTKNYGFKNLQENAKNYIPSDVCGLSNEMIKAIMQSSYFKEACLMLEVNGIDKSKTIKNLLEEKTNLENLNSKNCNDILGRVKYYHKSAQMAEVCLNLRKQKILETLCKNSKEK